jgi:subtilisin family serine protease
VSITSAWHTGNVAKQTISGTSMAVPHVAGAAALYLSGHAWAPPKEVAAALVAGAVKGRVTGAGLGSPNRLLQVID